MGKALLLIGIVILCFLLILFNFKLNQISLDFKDVCAKTYANDSSCFCKMPEHQNVSLANFSWSNITKN